jgi:L-ascorbate metabolism protein UlaG (beta-lactamase superfamily)
MEIQFLGHAALYIKTSTHNILVDPFISGNPKASSINIQDLSPHVILLTHAHEDHILDVEKIAKANDALIVSNFEIVSHFQKKGLKGHPMNHGGKWAFDFGELKYVNAIHTSSFPDGSYGGQPGGFVLSADSKIIYIAGDTALTYDMKLIANEFKLDLAILPIGDNFTMGIDDAIVASDFVECKKVLGYHFDTFGFIEIDRNSAVQKFSNNEKELILLEIGMSVSI